jgi:hypothetical protein
MSDFSEFADTELTIDSLMDRLCDYRKTVGGDCPIAIQFGDAAGYALIAGLIHGVYVYRDEASASGLHQIIPLGADLGGYPKHHPPRLALCLRPYCKPAALEAAQ